MITILHNSSCWTGINTGSTQFFRINYIDVTFEIASFGHSSMHATGQTFVSNSVCQIIHLLSSIFKHYNYHPSIFRDLFSIQPAGYLLYCLIGRDHYFSLMA